MFKFELGDKVKDTVTGFKGVVICRTEWLNGCLTYQVKAPMTKDGDVKDSVALDEAQMILVKSKYKAVEKQRVGGPERHAKRTN